MLEMRSDMGTGLIFLPIEHVSTSGRDDVQEKGGDGPKETPIYTVRCGRCGRVSGALKPQRLRCACGEWLPVHAANPSMRKLAMYLSASATSSSEGSEL